MTESHPSTTRDQQVTAYVDADLRTELEARAEKKDMSVSRLVAEVLEAYVEDDLVAMTSRQTEAEQRIEELVATATDDIGETTQEALDRIVARTELMERILLRIGIYSVGNWELLTDNVKEHRRSKAMQAASDVLKPAGDEIDIDINEIGAEGNYYSPRTSRQGGRNTAGKTEEQGDSDDEADDGWSY